ncbi:hypothetical protein [Halorubellus sp. PRR65]|uniref:Nmad3 family putative nucleotide modification protein n=1 Tax=Halorubellus sp. PRR65 TaxID=3098148 RepID=UPI002B26373F|nr:hypothetical protein [Halorubellus sp. PRR65]
MRRRDDVRADKYTEGVGGRMTVVLCGVGADTGNVRPVPRVDETGRFEYVPIPEKGETTETATYGSLRRRHADESLASLLDAVRPGSDGDWVTDPDAIANHAVHRDPNLDALTYGEHRPPYVAALADLDPGDVVGFYAGFRGPENDLKHRYLFGYLTVAEPPTVLDPAMDDDAVANALEAHPANAHARRHAAHGSLYYHDPAFTDHTESVVVVPGREPGGRLDRAIRLSDHRVGPNYYMADDVARVLQPARGGAHGTHLGGFKPAVECDVDPARFETFVADRVADAAD